VAYFLVHCDEDWNVIWDDYFYSIQEAVAQARHQFGDVRFAESIRADS
jgi:hypothetical protein